MDGWLKSLKFTFSPSISFSAASSLLVSDIYFILLSCSLSARVAELRYCWRKTSIPRLLITKIAGEMECGFKQTSVPDSRFRKACPLLCMQTTHKLCADFSCGYCYYWGKRTKKHSMIQISFTLPTGSRTCFFTRCAAS